MFPANSLEGLGPKALREAWLGGNHVPKGLAIVCSQGLGVGESRAGFHSGSPTGSIFWKGRRSPGGQGPRRGAKGMPRQCLLSAAGCCNRPFPLGREAGRPSRGGVGRRGKRRADGGWGEAAAAPHLKKSFLQ